LEALSPGLDLIPYLRQLQALAAVAVEAPESLRLAVALAAAQETAGRLSAVQQPHLQVRVMQVETTSDLRRTPAAVAEGQAQSVEAE
jgi:hypothetical protein